MKKIKISIEQRLMNEMIENLKMSSKLPPYQIYHFSKEINKGKKFWDIRPRLIVFPGDDNFIPYGDKNSYIKKFEENRIIDLRPFDFEEVHRKIAEDFSYPKQPKFRHYNRNDAFDKQWE